MTPFDPVALLTMLLAFYPIVSAAALATARQERPEYFAGGILFGTKGDKLRLPDGREFDCIVAAGGPASGRRWQCALIVFDPNAPVDPFPLEEGPLVPIDEDTTIGPPTAGTFEPIVVSHLEGFGGSQVLLDNAASAVAEFDGGQGLADDYDHTVRPAADAHALMRVAFDADDPAEVATTIDDHGTIIDGTAGQFDEDEPPDIPEPNPGPLPI